MRAHSTPPTTPIVSCPCRRCSQALAPELDKTHSPVAASLREGLAGTLTRAAAGSATHGDAHAEIDLRHQIHERGLSAAAVGGGRRT